MSGGGDEFDMFSSLPPFLTRIASLARRRTDLDPAAILALLVTGISAEAVVIAQALADPEKSEEELTASENLRLMSYSLKFVIMSSEHFDETDIEDRVDAALESMSDESRARLADDPIGALREAFGPTEETEGDEERTDSEEEYESESGGESSDDSSDGLSTEELRAIVAESVAAWDDWNPDDPLLQSLKTGFADSFSEAALDVEREERDAEIFE